MEKCEKLKRYRKTAIECILFSIAGMLVLTFTNYSFDTGEILIPEILFLSMLCAGGVVFLIGMVSFIIISKKMRKNNK